MRTTTPTARAGSAESTRATPGSAEAMKALRHLVERDGIGLSTIDFFGWTAPLGLPRKEQRRDYVLLKHDSRPR